MKRIVFLDYVRVFACFLVMVVHASENFYGAPGSTDMVGPQAFLANESDRLWVSMYDGFSRMAVPLFIIVSAFLLAPMKEGQSMWQFYRRRCIRILPPFFIFMILPFAIVFLAHFRHFVPVMGRSDVSRSELCDHYLSPPLKSSGYQK